MNKYEIYIEEAEEPEILEKNYTDLLISIITSCVSEVDGDEQSYNLSKGIY
ncbi:MAG: hypothetical protein WBL93_05210 [Lutisporaceae bacterium]